MSQCQIRKRKQLSELSEDNSDNQEREPSLDDNDESRPSGAGETCVFCRKKERVYRKSQIRKASHIELPRWQFLFKLLHIYSHHVFVVNVEDHPEFPDDETKVRLTFLERMRKKPYTRETVADFDLNKDVMNVNLYTQPTFNEEECVRRAYQQLHDYQQWEQNEGTYQGGTKDKKYNLFDYNCEHFVMQIKTGACVCLMLRHVADTVPQVTSTILSKGFTLVKAIIRIAGNLADDAVRVVEGSASVFSSAWLLPSLFLVFSLCVALYDYYTYKKLSIKGNICKGCYRQRLSKVVTLVVASVALAGFGVLASLFGGWILALVVSLVGGVFYGFLPKLFKKMYTFVLSCLPTRDVPKSNDVNPKTTNPGDVITFKYYRLPHDGVVTKLTPSSMYVAHYAWVPCSPREIIEEPFSLDRPVQLCDYANFAPYPREEVVKRARQRIGEKRFNMFTNRSSHFATWCKASKREGCQNYDWIEVFTWDEIKVGAAIKLWMYGRLHPAIFAEISRDKKRIKIYHRPGIIPDNMVKSEWIEFNLKVKTLYTRSYGDYTCCRPDEVIKRAEECKKNEKKFKNAEEFILHCKIMASNR